MPSSHLVFSGAQIAILCDDSIVTYLRDDKSTIPFPDHWDLPGGGREGDESPIDCALRELHEEFAIRLSPERVHWSRAYSGLRDYAPPSYFFVATVTADEIKSIVFGHEGQHWRMMPIAEFIGNRRAVGHLRRRLADYIAETDAQRIGSPATNPNSR